MNTTDLIDAAAAHDIQGEIFKANGHVHLGGKEGSRAGDLVRLFATLGCDVIKQPTQGVAEWHVIEHGRYIGWIGALANDLNSAFAFMSL